MCADTIKDEIVPPGEIDSADDISIPEEEEPQSPPPLAFMPPSTVICTPNKYTRPPNDKESPRVRKKKVVVTYQLSCRKCNKHLLVGTTSEDLKTTMGAHFDEVIRLIKCKGKKKEEEDADKFARHIAKQHFKSRFWKKVPSDEKILKFCQENAKIEVMSTEASTSMRILDSLSSTDALV